MVQARVEGKNCDSTFLLGKTVPSPNRRLANPSSRSIDFKHLQKREGKKRARMPSQPQCDQCIESAPDDSLNRRFNLMPMTFHRSCNESVLILARFETWWCYEIPPVCPPTNLNAPGRNSPARSGSIPAFVLNQIQRRSRDPVLAVCHRGEKKNEVATKTIFDLKSINPLQNESCILPLQPCTLHDWPV